MSYVEELAAGGLYGLVGIALLAVGYVVIDLLTPGKLGELLCRDRNRNAGTIVAAGMLAIGLIVSVAIVSADGDLGEGLAEAGGYGAVGIGLMALAFGVVDLLTPGKLGDIVTGSDHEPMAVVTAAALLAVGGIVAAAIS